MSLGDGLSSGKGGYVRHPPSALSDIPDSFSNPDHASFDTLGLSGTPLSQIFNLAVHTVPDYTFNNNRPVVSQLSGQNFVADLPKIDVSALKPQAWKPSPNREDLRHTALQNLKDVKKIATAFETTLKKIQEPLREALDTAAASAGADIGAAQMSFMPALPRTPATDQATATAQALNHARAGPGKLSAAQEAEIADRMYTLLTPTRNAAGEEIAPPAIESGFDFEETFERHEFLTVVKDLLRPPEMQPEGKVIYENLALLEDDILPHLDSLIDNYGETLKTDLDKLEAEAGAGTNALRNLNEFLYGACAVECHSLPADQPVKLADTQAHLALFQSSRELAAAVQKEGATAAQANEPALDKLVLKTGSSLMG